MPAKNPREELSDLVDKHLCQLMEHVSAVRIFVTREEGGVTQGYTDGRGNYYAQVGQVRTRVVSQDEHTRIEARSEMMAEEPEEPEDDDG